MEKLFGTTVARGKVENVVVSYFVCVLEELLSLQQSLHPKSLQQSLVGKVIAANWCKQKWVG